MIGTKLLHYEITEKLGEGGMGVVYKARDTHLDRFVAIKVLPPERVADPTRKARFIREAKAASALNHPNIVVVHDIAAESGTDFIVMEYVEGRRLDRVIGTAGLPIERFFALAREIAGALAKAHGAAIIHRDVKPANVMVTADGAAKLLDFGLAKLKEESGAREDSATRTIGGTTAEGTILGTVAYMSPEQLQGLEVDQRSDVFSLGALLYEMLAGRRPFEAGSEAGIVTAILRDPPAPLREVRPDVPPRLEAILARCLEKDRNRRYPGAAEVAQDLAACQAAVEGKAAGALAALRRPRYAIPAAAVLALIVCAAAWTGWNAYRAGRARQYDLPEIARLQENRETFRAFQLLQRVEKVIPGDPALNPLRDAVSAPDFATSEPAGATVEVQDYLEAPDQWIRLGTTPLNGVAAPRCTLRCRVSKPGYEVGYDIHSFDRNPKFAVRLAPAGSVPEGMVLADPRLNPTPNLPFTTARRYEQTPEFYIDRFEVTNGDYQKFVDAGGYTDRRYWKQPFLRDGRTIPWEDAVRQFRDATGRPGPATWEGGRFPPGREKHPVAGVNWYEAAAYAEFAGKSLPPVVYWLHAAGLNWSPQVVAAGNFGSGALAAAGSTRAMNRFGVFDMAGNVKEWCWNSGGEGRYMLGGAWNEPRYSFLHPELVSPFDRSAANGFRCVKHIRPPAGPHVGALPPPYRDFSKDQPVPDAVFKAYAAMYAYDKAPLNARVESRDTAPPFWSVEKITFDAAYGPERVLAYLWLPRNTAPPYQMVVLCTGRASIGAVEPAAGQVANYDWVVKSGRALLLPVYKGTFERSKPGDDGNMPEPAAFRQFLVQSFQDLARTLDYLETRNDVDLRRTAYLGSSMGAMMGLIHLALDPRLRVGVLIAGGFHTTWGKAPEVSLLNFAPRVHQPVLMVNGRYDHIFPYELAQVPLFRLLGSPEKDKRHVVVDSGHSVERRQRMGPTLEWLDRYLGPVQGAAR